MLCHCPAFQDVCHPPFFLLFWPVFSYIMPQKPLKLCIMLRITTHLSAQSHWATTELQMDPIRDLNQHTKATTVAVYILLHIVLVDKYLNKDCARDIVCP